MPRVMNPQSHMAKALDAPSTHPLRMAAEETSRSLLEAQVDLCGELPDTTQIQVDLGEARRLLAEVEEFRKLRSSV